MNKVDCLTLFCGDFQVQNAGKTFAADHGVNCYTDPYGLEIIEGKTFVRRKVYSTHLEGLFPLADGDVLVLDEKKKDSLNNIMEQAERLGIVLSDGMSQTAAEEPSGLIGTEEILKTEDLSAARLVLLGGKGLGSKANFMRLEAVAEKLGASCGCTRPVAMAGWTSYDKVVGLSGSILSADVCIAFGVSGAAPLMAGASGAARLIAVNNDAKAAIFNRCSEGIVADCLEVLTAMEQLADQMEQEV